jgi:DNA polymerase III delta prime subunit
MDLRILGNLEQLSHAYVSSSLTAEDIWRLMADKGFIKQSNPDALELELETFGVDESRDLSLWAIKKPFGNNRKVAVISAISVTVEAQNALLKLFEEPPERTHFFLLTPQAKSLLPTLLSRVHTLGENVDLESDKAKKFLAGDISERLKAISSIVKNKDKEKARNLVSALSALIKDERLVEAEKFLSGRSPSVKIILEHLAVVVVDSKHVQLQKSTK